jgi:hypothetical protein
MDLDEKLDWRFNHVLGRLLIDERLNGQSNRRAGRAVERGDQRDAETRKIYKLAIVYIVFPKEIDRGRADPWPRVLVASWKISDGSWTDRGLAVWLQYFFHRFQWAYSLVSIFSAHSIEKLRSWAPSRPGPLAAAHGCHGSGPALPLGLVSDVF